MVEWYIIAVLLVLLVVVAFVKYPNAGVKLVVTHLMKLLRDNEALLVQSIFYTLPKEIRNSVGSQNIATVVSYSILFISRLIKEEKL